MDKTTKVILGVGGLAAVVGAVWYFSSRRASTSLPVYQRASSALNPQTNAAAATAAEINAGAQGANALANLVSAVSDATGSGGASDDLTTSSYDANSDPSLSGLGGLYGRD